MKIKLGFLEGIAKGLVLIGALNWGLVGLFNFNLVTKIFTGFLVTATYTLVGLSAVFLALKMLKIIK